MNVKISSVPILGVKYFDAEGFLGKSVYAFNVKILMSSLRQISSESKIINLGFWSWFYIFFFFSLLILYVILKTFSTFASFTTFWPLSFFNDVYMIFEGIKRQWQEKEIDIYKYLLKYSPESIKNMQMYFYLQCGHSIKIELLIYI